MAHRKNEKYSIHYREIPLLYKIGAAVLVVLVVLPLFWYTEHLRTSLIEQNQRVLNAYAKLWSIAISTDLMGPAQRIIFDEVIDKAEYPLIQTNTDGEPIFWRNISGIPPGDTTSASKEKLRKMVKKMSKVMLPVRIFLGKSDRVLGYIYFGEPPSARWIRIIPLFEFALILVILVLGIAVYNRARSYEQQNIWLGMARESAHQLGTPVSSLLGWVELLREKIPSETAPNDPYSSTQIVDEMEKDLTLLNKIVTRFGQIGSLPELEPINVDEVVREVIDYLRERIPRLSGNISLNFTAETVPRVFANDLLISWACENLVKNSIEAVGRGPGQVQVAVRQNLEKNAVQVVVSDNGKGISYSDQKKIFSPGFTTKKRGWGLGLSLTKRIVEEYHHGRLYLLESVPYEKTTFILEIPT